MTDPVAADLLGEMRSLRKRTRWTRHGYWFPLLLFGMLSLGALPLYRAQEFVAGVDLLLPIAVLLLGGVAALLTRRKPAR